MTMRRVLRAGGLAVFAASVLTAGSAAVSVAPALAAGPCGTPVAAGTTCSMTGTVTLTGGTLTLTSPAALTWVGTLTGSPESLVDILPADQQLAVTDATGTAAGWHISAAATTFTNGASTFPDAGTFSLTGSTSSATATNQPSATCVVSCSLPTNNTTYPVAITTAASSPTPVTVYDTATGTGLGAILIGGSTEPNPVGWWVSVPATAIAGAYTSTITLEIVSGP